MKTASDLASIEILESGHFKADWYLDQYPDVAAAGLDPLEHYLSYGASEGRDPGPAFSTSGYLARYRDVAEAGINPLLHYIRYGRKERRLTTPCEDPNAIKRPYGNFGEYLTYSIVAPLVKAPFAVVDLNNFMLMEQVTRRLCRELEGSGKLPMVSVIMPMLDRAEVVGDAVRSVVEQSYSNFELIVVDDGSRDDSVSVVRAFADARIRLLENGKSTGVSAARNRGLAAARGELIAYLDSDNTWRPDYLRAMAGAFQVKPDADAAYCGQYLYRGCEHEPFVVRFGCYNPSLLRNHNYIDLNCFVHRRDILETIGGGFCEEIRRWVDWELILRISRVGKIYSVPILQSNYFMDKVENTISVTEELQPARHYITAKWGYDSQSGLQPCEDGLTRKVAVIVSGHGGLENLEACIDSLAGYIHLPLTQIIVVTDSLDPKAAGGLARAGVKTIFSEPGFDLFDAVDQAVKVSGADRDLLVLDPDATLSPGALPALQKAAYEDDSIAVTVPQQVLPGGDPTINIHVPDAFNDIPCDITLSNHHRNVETLALLHGGGPVDLNSAPFFCVYIKRDAWDLCGGLDARQARACQSERIVCDFVRQVLGRRIVYTPDAVIHHRKPAESPKANGAHVEEQTDSMGRCSEAGFEPAHTAERLEQGEEKMRSKILWRDRAKAWRGELLLSSLWVLKSLSRLPMLRHAYRGLLVHLIRATGLFDHAFYLDTHGDAVHDGIASLRHYVTCGDRQGRSPMAFFDPDHYRSRARGRTKYVNALLHYALVGRYLRISPSPWFDVDFYLALNKDVARAGFDPLFHYLKWGGFEGRSPSPEFDSAYYMQAYPDVARLRLNPLDHYLRIGRFEGRRTVSEDSRILSEGVPEDVPQPSIPGRDAWNDLRSRAGIDEAQVDVVVPVYKGRAETLRCLHSVLAAACTTSFELVVIDDAGPDAELVGDLQGLAGQGLFSLLVNPKNLGFVRTANLGMALHPGRDMVLLNSDTQVFDGWLDRLRQAAQRHGRTATVTPLSNNATICSYPRFLQDNPFPLELSHRELDILTAAVNAGAEVEAPTGVGFCMYIKHPALEEVGPFDEAAFGRGYGEENDFCQRAIRKGWRNIIAADVFVHHWGSASFQGEKAKRVRQALKTMDRLHPHYQKDVARFIERDPLSAARRRLDNARLKRVSRKKNVLLVCHNRGGGAERHVQEEILRLNQEGYGVFLLRPAAGRPSHAVLRHPAARSLPNLPSVSLADTAAMTAALKELGITAIHTHSLVDFGPDAPDHLVALVKALGARWEVNLHDYKVICPRINLADGNGCYCGEPPETACVRCLCEHGSDFGVTDIRAWRAMHRRALLAADQVRVPDPDVAERLGRYYPEVGYNVSPHQHIDPARIRPRLPRPAADERLRIVVIGAIGKIKGFDVLLACARNAGQRGLPLEFILMGYSMNDRLLHEVGVKVTGRYLEENAQDTLEALSPNLVWLPSVWPETYSYTLSIALQAGLPVAAFDIGAIARRIGECDPTAGHRLFPLDMAGQPDQLNDYFTNYQSLQFYPHEIYKEETFYPYRHQ